jgi:hypothetical protein
MTDDEHREYRKRQARSYGTIQTRTEPDGQVIDFIMVEPWGVKLEVGREPGQTEPNYEGLCIAGYHVGIGLGKGAANGREQAFRELRALIGVKE